MIETPRDVETDAQVVRESILAGTDGDAALDRILAELQQVKDAIIRVRAMEFDRGLGPDEPISAAVAYQRGVQDVQQELAALEGTDQG